MHTVNQSGFFPTQVVGHLRPTAQIVQWNIASPNPSGLRHVESGAIKRTANQDNRGGFTAQKESGIAINFGNKQVNDGDAFASNTTCLTFNFGQLNENPKSHFDLMYNNGSGEASANMVGFNFRFWVGNLSAFDTVALSGGSPLSSRPIFYFRESADWRRKYVLELTEPSGLTSSGTFPSGAPQVPVSGVHILPSSMPDFPNIYTRERDISISGSFIDREHTNFIYTRAFFPALPSGQTYKLGTYGGLGQNNFRLKFSYDYTSFNSNIVNPEDLADIPIFITKQLPDAGIAQTVSGWWQLNNSSPQLSRASGFVNRSMTMNEITEDAVGTIGLASGIVSSGTSSGVCVLLRSNRRDSLQRPNPFDGEDTCDFGSTMSDGSKSFTITGWFALNDPSGLDPAATGVGARIPTLDTGIICRWNTRLGTPSFQYQLFYHRQLNRFLWRIQNQRGTTPFIPYNYLSVDSQDNGLGDSFGLLGSWAPQGAAGGGPQAEKWYFFVIGYDKDSSPSDGSVGGTIFMRINDGPIERLAFGAETKGLFTTVGQAANPPFSIAGSTITEGNGSLIYGAGRYDNITLHRGKVLSNEQQLRMYNRGFGREYPIGTAKDIDFSLPPQEALFQTDPNPIPLRRSLRGFYNFNEPSGSERFADGVRYSDCVTNVNTPSGNITGSGIPTTSGILPAQVLNFSPISGAIQIRKVGGIGFEDGSPGNGQFIVGNTDQVVPYGFMSYTLAVYCRFPRAGFQEDILSSWSATGNNRFLRLRKNASNNFTFERANGTTVGQPATMTAVPSPFRANDWYLVVVRAFMTGSPAATNYDMRMDVANIETGESSFATQSAQTFHWGTSVPSASVPFCLGASETLSVAEVGDVDIGGFGSWYRALSNKEITQLINNGNGLNFGDPIFGKITRVYWDSDLKRADDPSTK